MPRCIRTFSKIVVVSIALFFIASLHAENAPDPFIARLQNSDVAVRKTAIAELQKKSVSTEEHLPALITSLKDKTNISTGITQGILQVLEPLHEGASPAVPTIVEMFPSWDERSQPEAISILIFAKPKPDQVLSFYIALMQDLKWQSSAALLLQRLGHDAAPAIPALEAAFQQLSDDKVIFADALSVVSAPRAEFVPLAKRSLQSANDHMRSNGLSLASHLGPFAPEVFPELVARLENSADDYECERIIKILDASPKKAGPAVPALCKKFRRANAVTQYDVLQIFSKMGADATDAAPMLREILASENQGINREELRKILAEIGLPEDAALVRTPKTPQALVAALSDSDRAYSNAAEKALKELGDGALPALREGLKQSNARGRKKSVGLLFQCKGITLDDCAVLTELIQKDSAPEVRRQIAERLNRIAFLYVDNVPLAQRCNIAFAGLKDPDEDVRRDCIGSLSGMKLEYKSLLKVIQDGLGDTSAKVRGAAFFLISSDLPKPCESTLYEGMLAFAASRTSKVNLIVFPLLFEAGIPAKKALPVLTAAAQDADPDVGVAAVETLGKYGIQAQPAVDVLLVRLKTGPAYVQIEIAKALIATGGPAEPAVTILREIIRRDPALSPVTDRQFSAAVGVLRLFGEKAASARPELIAALSDSSDREVNDILYALEEIQIGTEADALKVLKFSTDKNDAVRFLAFSIVSKLHPIPASYVQALKTEMSRVDPTNQNGGEILELALLPNDVGPAIYRSLFQNKNPVIRSTSARMLARYSPLTAELAQSVLDLAAKDPDPSVRRAIISSAFENRKKAELLNVIPVLEHIAKTDTDKLVRLTTRETLRRIEFED